MRKQNEPETVPVSETGTVSLTPSPRAHLDELVGGIREGIYVTDLVVGEIWTAVRTSEGSVGFAMTTDGQTLEEKEQQKSRAERSDEAGKELVGKELKEVAGLVLSWDFLRASIGMAAVNAFYNTEKRLKEIDSEQKDDRFCTFDLDVRGKNVVMVGSMKSKGSDLDTAASVKILERGKKPGTYPDSACEYIIPESDIVIITGSAFINKTMPRLLQLSGDGGKKVIVTGPSTPMCGELLKLGIDRLAGLVMTDPGRAFEFAANGTPGTPYDAGIGKRFVITR